ncbi:MAG: hypothetical protein MI919_21710, partial [Holophagales bacterium]|nr:hypothetical protein [Holophagales bacterium]
LEATLAQPRAASALLAIFALLATLLGGLGVYSVMAFRVVHQRHEMAVRAAMGASRAALADLVLRGALRLAARGAAIGFLLSLFAGRLLERLVYDVGAGRLPVLVAIALAIVPLALLAAWLPARRAMEADPARISRGE